MAAVANGWNGAGVLSGKVVISSLGLGCCCTSTGVLTEFEHAGDFIGNCMPDGCFTWGEKDTGICVQAGDVQVVADSL